MLKRKSILIRSTIIKWIEISRVIIADNSKVTYNDDRIDSDERNSIT